MLVLQERDEAAKLFEDQKATEAARKESANTFVPGEALEQDKVAGGEANGETAEPMAVDMPKPPTAEQLTAIKVGGEARLFYGFASVQRLNFIPAADSNQGGERVDACKTRSSNVEPLKLPLTAIGVGRGTGLCQVLTVIGHGA